jgi:hypothetical protein
MIADPRGRTNSLEMPIHKELSRRRPVREALTARCALTRRSAVNERNRDRGGRKDAPNGRPALE